MHPSITLDYPSESSSVTLVRRNIGNATRETDLSVTFTIDKNKLTGITSLPFQVHDETKGHSHSSQPQKNVHNFNLE